MLIYLVLEKKTSIFFPLPRLFFYFLFHPENSFVKKGKERKKLLLLFIPSGVVPGFYDCLKFTFFSFSLAIV